MSELIEDKAVPVAATTGATTATEMPVLDPVLDIERLEALLQAVPPGPYRCCGAKSNDGPCGCGLVWSVPASAPVFKVLSHTEEDSEFTLAPGAYKAACDYLEYTLTVLPQLVALVREQRACLSHVREYLISHDHLLGEVHAGEVKHIEAVLAPHTPATMEPNWLMEVLGDAENKVNARPQWKRSPYWEEQARLIDEQRAKERGQTLNSVELLP